VGGGADFEGDGPKAQRRMAIYRLLLQHMGDEQRIQVATCAMHVCVCVCGAVGLCVTKISVCDMDIAVQVCVFPV
jgi:hypothetical protein